MKRRRSRPANTNLRLVCLLGLGILAAGITVTVSLLVGCELYFRSASWDRVDAVIESVSLGGSHPGRGASYQVQCAYSYTYKGKTYRGRRVGTESERATWDLWKLRQQVLQEHLDKKKPVRAWVNPSWPGESLLFRELTEDLYWPPLKGLIVVLVGAGVFSVGLRKIVARKRLESKLLRYPDRPWRVDGSWDDFTIHAHNATTVIACWVVGIMLALFVRPAFTDLPPLEVLPFYVMPCLVALFALWLIGKAVYLTLRFLKYGNPILALPQLPIVPGTQFRAVLFVKRHLVTEHGVQLTLKCVRTKVTGAGKSQSVDTNDLHTETRIVTKDMAQTTYKGSAIPVVFDVPTGLPDRETERNPSYEWTLEVKAQTPGIDFSAEFDLPVYAVKDQSLVEKRPVGMTQTGVRADLTV